MARSEEDASGDLEHRMGTADPSPDASAEAETSARDKEEIHDRRCHEGRANP
jgi:hypothetical protein